MAGVAEIKTVKRRSPPQLSGKLGLFGFRSKIVTASETMTMDDLGSVVFSQATTAVTFTLPAPCGEGGFFLFVNATAANGTIPMTVTAPTDQLRLAADPVNATSIAFTTNATAAGAAILVISDGSNWWGLPLMSQSTVNTGIVNYTVT